MISIAEFKEIYDKIKTTIVIPDSDFPRDFDMPVFSSFSEFLCTKFFETSGIFKILDFSAISKFCKESDFLQIEENQKIFSKEEECDSYYFILHGDIYLYDQDLDADLNHITNSNKLMKTISAGSIYGHKIRSNFNFLAIAKNSTFILKIKKNIFDNIIEETNKRKDRNKLNFLKKYFPKLRIYSDDVLNPLKSFFIREEHYIGNKILNDTEYDEYIYLVINGNLGVAKSIKKIKNLKETMMDETNDNFNVKNRYVVLEKFNKGDLFGAYSALKHQKNNYTVLVLSDKAEIYKLSKAHCLLYFGGSAGIIPEALRGIDTCQQLSLNHKINYLERCHNPEAISKFTFFIEEHHNSYNSKKPIDESIIENNLKNAWKELENLGSKISQFKDSLLNKNTGSSLNKQNILFSKPKSNVEVECKLIL